MTSQSIPPPEYLLAANQESSYVNIQLFKAALAGSLTGVENAIGKGGRPNFFHRPEDQKNSLHVAAENGFVDIVETLIDAGAVVDSIASTSQSTALIFASQGDNAGTVSLLLAKGANIHAANGYGNTALHEAARQGLLEVTEILLAARADVNASNKKGSTPLHFCMYGDGAEVPVALAAALISAGANVNSRDTRGNTPFLVCCMSGRMDMIQLLLEHGADPTIRNELGEDAVAVASFYNHEEIARRFNFDSPGGL